MKPRDILFKPVHFISLGFGTGLSPFAPGTAGTLVGIIFYLGMTNFTWWTYSFVVLLFTFVGFYLCDETSRVLHDSDPSCVVWDEIVGYLITMYLVPREFVWILAGFLIFRFFDILKPWPIRRFEKLKGGYGIMADDLMAGFYSWMVMQALLYLVPGTID